MLRPRQILETFGQRHPGAWRALDNLRAGRLGAWPVYVYAPLDLAGVALATAQRTAGRPLPSHTWEIIAPAQELAGLAAWRVTQQVFRFDPDLYQALLETPIAGLIPGAHFRRLPAWGVYVETPGLCAPLVGGGETPVHGTFAWLDWRADRREDILTLGLDTDLQLAVGYVPLVGSLDEGLAQVEADWREGRAAGVADSAVPDGFAAAARSVYGRLLSLLLYLCADDADYQRPPWPAPRRTKKGLRLFPPDQPSIWTVGERIGAVLRHATDPREPGTAAADGHRSSPRAHVRAAHWHSFWRGARDGERERVVRWLPPILVGADGVTGLPVTVRPVRAH